MNLDGVVGEFSTLPGCSQITVSHGVYVPLNLRRKGLGTQANERRQAEARTLGYDYMMCTVSSENVAQIRVMEKTNWKLLDRFTSSRTDHDVLIYGKAIN